jgi:N-acetylneuraminate synthase
MTFDLDFIKEVADRNKHTFISTAMTSEKQIEKIIDIFDKKKCSFELMHCVSTYPLKPENANLKRILTLREKFNCKVGYSGHEDGVAISLAAVTMRITSLERHITLDRTMYGSDQAASLGLSGCRELIASSKKIEMANQKKGKIDDILEEEKKISDKLRAHLKNYKPYYNK